MALNMVQNVRNPRPTMEVVTGDFSMDGCCSYCGREIGINKYLLLTVHRAPDHWKDAVVYCWSCAEQVLWAGMAGRQIGIGGSVAP